MHLYFSRIKTIKQKKLRVTKKCNKQFCLFCFARGNDNYLDFSNHITKHQHYETGKLAG